MYDAFDALFVADSVNVNGLNNSTQVASAYTSNAYCLGNDGHLSRRGDPQRTYSVPRIEFDIASDDERDAPDHSRVEAVVRLHHICDREAPTGFGTQNTVVSRSRTVFHRSAPAAQSGWNFSTVKRIRGFQAPSDEKKQHYIDEYLVIASRGSSGGF